MTIKFNEQEDEWWTCTRFKVAKGRPAIRLTLTSDSQPGEAYISAALQKL